MTDNKPKEKKVLEIIANSNLQVLSVDHLAINLRSDNSCLLRFSAQLPEGILEQAKVMVQKEKLEEMINVMCNHLGYYPQKPTPQKVDSPKGKAKKK